MALKGYTDNYGDNSTEAGFQFTFFCDHCREGYKSAFVNSSTYKKAKLFSGLGKVASAGASMAGAYRTSTAVNVGQSLAGERFHGMSPQWQKEHETAFFAAQEEAKPHFKRCPKCTRYFCDKDWNEQAGLCVADAPRAAVEMQAARGQKMISEIHQQVQQQTVFTGKVEDKQVACAQCGQPAGSGKFCANCGAPVGLVKCPKCSAQLQAGVKFCPECGNKMG